jgi:mannose-1-phosphate guanylyltransferase
MIIPVILCGGVGSRLWPVSRKTHPKQFLKIDGKHSLFQKTALRVNNSKIFSSPIIICNESYKFKIASELEEIGIKPEAIIIEEEGKNTCPAISLSAHYIKQQLQLNSQMLILPADHIIEEESGFLEYIKTAAKNLSKHLMTFGITPTYAATGYGYIQIGEKLFPGINKVKKFTEKPDKDTAKEFISTNEYYWNSGMFLFDTGTYLSELQAHKLEIFNYTKKAIANSKKIFNFIQIDKEVFSKCEDISVDYAIFEKTLKTVLMPINIKWYDLGNWQSIYDYHSKDSSNNVSIGDNINANTSKNCLVYSDSKSHIVLHKVDNIFVIVTNDAVLVVNKNHAEEVKTIYNKLKADESDIVNHSNKHYRPWGYYEDLLVTQKYRVKLIQLNPHSQISLQYHNKRAEHWVITQGYAQITLEKETFTIKKDESVYIPVGKLHQIKNTADSYIEFIEVQIGDYVGEDDIVRVKDPYKRRAMVE